MIRDYQFNSFQVCTNPSILYKNKASKVELFLGVASFQDYWESFLSYSTPYGGCGWLPNKFTILSEKLSFPQSIDNGFEKAISRLNGTLADTNSCKPDYLDSIVQQELDKFTKWYRSFKANNYNLEVLEKKKLESQMVQGSLF